jgi:ribosomal protein L16 Arg81 hydroxylase
VTSYLWTTNLFEASEVRILNIRQSINTVELQAGYCLYVPPPRVMHCGTSTSNDCITLSVGCREPSSSRVTEFLKGLIEEGVLYGDEVKEDNEDSY